MSRQKIYILLIADGASHERKGKSGNGQQNASGNAWIITENSFSSFLIIK